MNKKKTSGLARGLRIIGLILVIGVITMIATYKPRCMKYGCKRAQVEGSHYCEQHKPEVEDPTPGWFSDSEGSSGKSSPAGKATSSNSENPKYYSRPGHSSNSTPDRPLNNDPADYDSPEDYADDAWGDDFEDWDEAYEFWEDY